METGTRRLALNSALLASGVLGTLLFSGPSQAIDGVSSGSRSEVTPTKAKAISTALQRGLHPVNVPYIPTQYGPFVRQIRTGTGAPPPVKACVQIEVMSGYGILKTSGPDGQPKLMYGDPYPYLGIQLDYGDAQSPQQEYIEAGMGFPAKKHSSDLDYFLPYIRRAPDDQSYALDTQFALKSPWTHPQRGDKAVPGYWLIRGEDHHNLMAPNGSYCLEANFDAQKNIYTYHITIEKNLEDGGITDLGTVSVASARSEVASDPVASAIHGFQIRLLTSVATTGDSYNPADPMYQDTVFGASWRASVQDAHGEWQAFDQEGFHIENGDVLGDVIYYKLESIAARAPTPHP